MSPSTLLWLITGCLMLQPLSTDLYLSSLPHLATDFRVNAAAVQQTLTFFVFGFGGAQLISGPLSDRYGRRPVVLGGLASYVAASLACALAPTLPLLVAGRFLQALGCCSAVVVARAIVRDVYTPTDGARVIARASSLLSFAPILGPVAGGYLQIAFGWRAAFLALAGYGLILLVAATRHLSETNRQPNPTAMQLRRLLAIYREILQSRAFWSFALPGALSYAAIFVFISGSSVVLIQVLGIRTEHYGYLFGFGVVGYLCGTLVCRRLLSQRSLAATLELGTTVGLGGGAAFLGLVLAGYSHWSVLVCALFIVMFAHGINFPCAQAGAVAPFPAQAGSAAGVFGATSMTGALVAGVGVGHTYNGTLLPLALISVTVTAVTFLVTRRLGRSAHQ